MPSFLTSVESDIETTILQALQQVFQDELITQISDALKVRRLARAPLQDDPTTTAPYLVYGIDWHRGSAMADPEFAEIGGNILWEVPLIATCGTPRRTTKELANQAISILRTRIERVLMRHYDLSGILSPSALTSADNSAFVDVMSPAHLELTTRQRYYGGESEWYGEALFQWKYNYYRVRDW